MAVEFALKLVDHAELTLFARQQRNEMDLRQYPLSQLFPNTNTNGLSYTISRQRMKTVDAAVYRAFDTGARLGARQGFTKIAGEILPLSEMRAVHEEQMHRERAFRTGNNDSLIEAMFNDTLMNVAALGSRIEFARGEVLETGKLVINENGLSMTIDFGRDPSMTTAAATLWSNHAAATPIADIRGWVELYQDRNLGVSPGAILMSTKVRSDMLRCAEVKSYLNLVNGTTPIITLEQLQQVLVQHDLPPIVLADHKGRRGGVEQRYFSDKKIALLPPAGDIAGATLYTETAESMALTEAGVLSAEGMADIAAVAWQEINPVSTYTLAAAVAMPVLGDPDGFLVATVRP